MTDSVQQVPGVLKAEQSQVSTTEEEKTDQAEIQQAPALAGAESSAVQLQPIIKGNAVVLCLDEGADERAIVEPITKALLAGNRFGGFKTHWVEDLGPGVVYTTPTEVKWLSGEVLDQLQQEIEQHDAKYPPPSNPATIEELLSKMRALLNRDDMAEAQEKRQELDVKAFLQEEAGVYYAYVVQCDFDEMGQLTRPVYKIARHAVESGHTVILINRNQKLPSSLALKANFSNLVFATYESAEVWLNRLGVLGGTEQYWSHMGLMNMYHFGRAKVDAGQDRSSLPTYNVSYMVIGCYDCKT